MHRRAAVGRLAATVAGLSLAELPDLETVTPPGDQEFSVTPESLAESSGTATCPVCQEMADALELTPAGLCLRCANRNPGLRATPHSDPFWKLSPREVHRLEGEIQRLAAKLNRMNEELGQLQQRQRIEGGNIFDRAMESQRESWQSLQRELHLLHLLRAASRQFA
jgi:hypothetical protein